MKKKNLSPKKSRKERKEYKIAETVRFLLRNAPRIIECAGKHELNADEIAGHIFRLVFQIELPDSGGVGVTGLWVQRAIRSIGHLHGPVPYRYDRKKRRRFYDLTYIAALGSKEVV